MKKSLIDIKKKSKDAILKSVRVSPMAYHAWRRKGIDQKKLPMRYLLKDIDEIRRQWSLGYSDLEIRKRMQINFRQWKRRLDRMRAVPPQDDTVKSFERYFLEHTKYVAKLERRQRRLNELYVQATEEIEGVTRFGAIYKRPRDLELARAVMMDLAVVDKDLIKAEQDLIQIKQKLGIIDQTPQKVEITGVFNVGVLEQAWAHRRNQKSLPDPNPDQKPLMDDAVLVEPPD